MNKPNRSYLELDVHKIPFKGDGLEDCVWPISDKARTDACDEFILKCTQLLLAYNTKNGIQHSYNLCYKYIFSEFSALFWALSLKHYCDEKKIHTNVPDNFRYLPYILNGTTLPQSETLKKLTLGPQANIKLSQKFSFKRLKKITKLLNFKKSALTVGNLKIKPITQFVLNNNIIATQRLKMIDDHAAQINEDVIFCKTDRWFQTLSNNELEQETLNKKQDLESDIITLIADIFRKYNVPLNDEYKNHFINYLETISAIFRCHLNKLDVHCLPKRVWTGSGGNPWDAMVRLKVLDNGGYVAGHDHGAGLAHVNNYMMGLMEFWGCSEFFVENKNCQSVFKQQKQNWPSFTSEQIEISYIQKKQAHQVDKSYKKNKIQTIMIPIAIYDGDRGRPGPYSSNLTYADWQDRLAKFLNDQGYRIVFKIHPETPTIPPYNFTQNHNVIIDKRNFSEALKEVDIVLIDHLYTSVFKEVLETNLPFIMIDFYNHPLTDNALKLFQKRAELIIGSINDQNRYSINWNALDSALSESVSKSNNTEFFNYYYR